MTTGRGKVSLRVPDPGRSSPLEIRDAGEWADPRFRFLVLDAGKVVAGFREERRAEAYRMHVTAVRKRM